MLKLSLSTLVLIIAFSVKLYSQASKVDSSMLQTLRIDPSSARGAAASQVFDEIKFIPLETTKESLFGTISQLRVTDDRYVIWDNDTKSVLIFDRSGKYKAKVNGSKIEKDPESKQNQSFYGFTLKKEDGKQLIQLIAGEYFFYFDLEAKLIKKVKINEYSSSYSFPDGTLLELNHKEKKVKDSAYFEISLIKNKQRVESYFQYSPDRYDKDEYYTTGESITNSGNPNEFFSIRPYEYNVFRVTPTKLYLSYKMIFPANNSLPPGFLENPLYVGKRRDYFDKNPKVFYALGSTYQIGENLYFKVANMNWGGTDRKAFIYNLKNKTTTSIADIEPDTLSQFLPVTDAGVHYEFANKGFHIFDGKYFYTSYSSLLLFKFKEQSENKERTYDPALTEYFKTQDKKSNPVLIQLKPKNN